MIEVTQPRSQIDPQLFDGQADDGGVDGLNSLSLIHISEPTRPY
jgi:hypothetical protein